MTTSMNLCSVITNVNSWAFGRRNIPCAVLLAAALLPLAIAQELTLFAGSGERGSSGDGGPATAAELNQPGSVSVDPDGNVLIADTGNGRIRRVDASGKIETVAGCTGCVTDLQSMFFGGQATKLVFNKVSGLACDFTGNVYFIAESFNPAGLIWKLMPGGDAIPFAGAGTGTADGVSVAQSLVMGVTALAADHAGRLHLVVPVSDSIDQLFLRRVRMIASDGTVTTVAGGGNETADGIPATQALLKFPQTIAFDHENNLYIAESDPLWVFTNGNRVRKVDASGTIVTVAGGGNDFTGEGIAATNAMLGELVSIAADRPGNLFIASAEGRVRKVNTEGLISTIDLKDRLVVPAALAVDRDGNLFIADRLGNRIWKVTFRSE